MRVVRLRRFGPPDALVVEEADDLEPAPSEVRIAVAAAGVHVIDTAIRAGTEGWFPLPRLPVVLGRDVAGTVDAVGSDVDVDWLGRGVVAYLGPAGGGYADAVVAPAAALHALPDDVDEAEAVAMIGTGRTTLAILEVATLSADHVVVVTAAAGGIGSLLVQAGRNAGATVVGLAGGAAKVDFVRRLGATAAVDYTAPGWVDTARAAVGEGGATVVLDGVGGDLGRGAMDLLGIGGRLVLFGWSSGTPTQVTTDDLYARSLTVSVGVGPRVTQRPGGLRGLEQQALTALAAGELRPQVTRFPLVEAAAAHAALEGRRTTGKVVLVPST